MPDDLRRSLEDASVGPRTPLDMPRALERARRSRRHRTLGVGALIIALLIPAVVFATNLKEPPRIPTPPVEGPSPTIHEDSEEPDRKAITALAERMVLVQTEIAMQHSRMTSLKYQLALAVAANRTGRAAELRDMLRARRAAIRALETQLDALRDTLAKLERQIGRGVELCSAEELSVEVDWGAAAGSYGANATFTTRGEGACRLYKDFRVELKAEGKDQAIASARNLADGGPPWVTINQGRSAGAVILWSNWCKDLEGPFYYLVHPGEGTLRIDIEGSASCSGGTGTTLGVVNFKRLDR